MGEEASSRRGRADHRESQRSFLPNQVRPLVAGWLKGCSRPLATPERRRPLRGAHPREAAATLRRRPPIGGCPCEAVATSRRRPPIGGHPLRGGDPREEATPAMLRPPRCCGHFEEATPDRRLPLRGSGHFEEAALQPPFWGCAALLRHDSSWLQSPGLVERPSSTYIIMGWAGWAKCLLL